MFKGVVITVIPHKEQRYDTPGDWWIDGDNVLQIRVSEMSDVRSSMAVAIHELISATICTADGITASEIDEFDFEFEQNRQPGDNSEPGDDPNAPNHKAFTTAFPIERQVVEAMGMDWNEHDETVNALSEVRTPKN